MVAAVKLPEPRTYTREDCVTFRKTAEKFGGLSNMAGGYPLFVNGVRILTSEALYQACRFPHLPDVQRLIIAERSPMTAKMRSKPYRNNSRSDWDIVRTKVMRWCLQVKLIQNWDKFSRLLLATEDLPIVEDSRKDDFWGAKPADEKTLIGANVLGRLLMQLREQIKSGEITSQTIVKPLSIPNFLFYEREIVSISAESCFYKARYTETFLDIDEVKSTITSGMVLYGNPLENWKHDGRIFLQEEIPPQEEVNKDLGETVQFENIKYSAFHIMLPYIENLLKTEHTDKELAEVFDIPLKLMRNWLEQAVKLGKIKKLSKPIRYIAEPQLPLIS